MLFCTGNPTTQCPCNSASESVSVFTQWSVVVDRVSFPLVSERVERHTEFDRLEGDSNESYLFAGYVEPIRTLPTLLLRDQQRESVIGFDAVNAVVSMARRH